MKRKSQQQADADLKLEIDIFEEKHTKGMDFRKCIIDFSQYDFKLKASEVPRLEKIIIEKSRDGSTMSMILFDLRIRRHKWMKFYKKHPKLGLAIQDAIAYHKAWGESALKKMATNPIFSRQNGKLVELFMKHFFDIGDEYKEPVEIIKRENGYNVELNVINKGGDCANCQYNKTIRPAEQVDNIGS